MAGNRVIPAIIHFNKVLCCVASWLARSVRSFAHQKSDQLGAVQMMRLCGIQRVSIADDHEGLECLARLTAHFDRLGRMCVELRFSVEQVLQNCRCCSATCCLLHHHQSTAATVHNSEWSHPPGTEPVRIKVVSTNWWLLRNRTQSHSVGSLIVKQIRFMQSALIMWMVGLHCAGHIGLVARDVAERDSLKLSFSAFWFWDSVLNFRGSSAGLLRLLNSGA